MTTMTFDTLGYFEKLKIAGVPESQAKVQVETMQDIVRTYDEASRKELATKGDIQDLRNEVKMEIQAVRADMEKLEYRITIRLGAMMAASIAIVATLVKLL